LLTSSPHLLPKDAANRHQPPADRHQDAKTDEGLISDAYLFMPYIYYETQEHREKMVQTYEGFRNLKHGSQRITDHRGRSAPNVEMHGLSHGQTEWNEASSPTTDKNDLLFRAHHSTPEAPLHIRRTLDQFFYHNIDTSERDRDQVLHRYQGVVQNIEPHLHKILMVDQLWM
jgi:hypothetical protein